MTYVCDDCSCWTGDDKWCQCERRLVFDAWRVFAGNVAAAAFGQAAYLAGSQFGFQWARREPVWPTAWDPGEGKPYRLLTPEQLDPYQTWSPRFEERANALRAHRVTGKALGSEGE
jgi:hypothetical protein